MTVLTKARLIGCMAVIFLTGVVCGSVISIRGERRKQQLQTVEKACHRMRQDLKARLSLSDVQFKGISPILDRMDREIKEVQFQTIGKVESAVHQSFAEMENMLTPPQQERLHEYAAERRRRVQEGCASGQGPKDRLLEKRH